MRALPILTAVLLFAGRSAWAEFDNYGVITRPHWPTLPPVRDVDPTHSDITFAEPTVSFPDPVPQGITVENSAKLRAWVADLCHEETVASLLAERRQENGFSETVRTPRNSAGSLLLLLENYEDDVTYLDACRKQREQVPAACHLGSSGPIPRHPLVLVPPPGVSSVDLAAVCKADLKAIREVFGKHYSELRDLGALNGSPESAATARKIRNSVEAVSTCQVRAIASQAESRGPYSGR